MRLVVGLAVLANLFSKGVCETECFDVLSGFSRDDWKHCQQINHDLFMYYSPMEEIELVKLGLHAPNHSGGWSSLALGGNGGMKGASQIVVRKESDEDNAAWVAEDRYSVDYAMPTLDDSQDVELLFARDSDGSGTSWGVILKMNSCDEQDYPIEDLSSFMHWALGSSHTFAYHGANRGQFHANLLQAPMVYQDTNDMLAVDLRMPDVDVVIGEGGGDPRNPYICSFFDLETLLPDRNMTEKQHVSVFSPFLDGDSKQYVHHMLLYTCDDTAVESENFKHMQVIPECESMPSGCYEMKWLWAVGSEEVHLPENVGMSFGEGRNMMLIQMHYYNPDLDQGIKDSSGVRLHFTQSLREYDAGIMTFDGGTQGWQRPPIPAGKENAILPEFVVPSTCTNRWESSLNIVGITHHAHLVGRKITVEIERDGQSLGVMRKEHFYDFNHQSQEESLIKQFIPGDSIKITCSYDTSGREEDVEFGDYTNNEMCFVPVMYYPRQDFEWFSYRDPSSVSELYNNTVISCSTAGTASDWGNFSDVSACTQSMMTNLDDFYGWGVGQIIPAIWLCNSEYSVDGICPPCHKKKECSFEELKAFGQNVVCANVCASAGVSVYPLTSNVTNSQPTHATLCREVNLWFDHVSLDAPTCVPKGNFENFDRDSEPKDIGSDASAAQICWKLIAASLLLFTSAM